MGVHGLWQLLSSTGKPVPLESLEGKVLAVDVSVWLHQLSKGMRDSSGNPVPNAHLHGLFTRICKLLYYRIKPIFVFDGGVPVLKKQTLSSRRNKREEAERTSSLMQQKILTNLIRGQVLKEAYGLDKLPDVPPSSKSSSKTNREAIFELPPIPESSQQFLKMKSSEDETYKERCELQKMVEENYEDVNTINVESSDFKALPFEVQHEIINDIRLSRKNYNLSRITELPADSQDFSSFQMSKLLKHSKLNNRLDVLKKELNKKQTKSLSLYYGKNFNDYDEVISQRVMSEDSSHYVLAKRNLAKKKAAENKELLESKTETVDEKSVKLVASDHDMLLDSDEDIDLLEESKLIFRELSESNETENSTELRAAADNQIGASTTEMRVDEKKPRFKAVIEIETDSDSDNSEIVYRSSEVGRFENDLVEADFHEDHELQMAIELSLRDKRKSGAKGRDNSLDSEKVVGVDDEMQENNGSEDNQSFKSSRQPDTNFGVPLVFAKGQTTNKTYITADNDTANQIKNNISCKKIEKVKKGTKYIERRDDTEVTKGDKIKSADKAFEITDVSKDTSSDTNEPYKEKTKSRTTEDGVENRVLESEKNKLFKKNISLKSIDSNENSEGTRRIKVIDSSDDESIDDNDIHNEDSSSSEDDFIEVKVDLTEVTEDNMFPASMFEPAADIIDESSPKRPKLESRRDNSSPLLEKGTTEMASSISDGSTEGRLIGNAQNELKHKKQIKNDDASVTMATMVDNDHNECSETADMEKSVVTIETESDHDDNFFMRSEKDLDELSDTDEVSALKVETNDEGQILRRPTSPQVTSLAQQFESVNEQRIKDLSTNLTQVNRELRLEQGRQERLAVSITDQMHSEAQDLLQLFGIPYIVSPTEAEAQCAQLELSKLSHGTITDDSDIWLFGGKCVFKNFFNQQKHVECFKEEHIKSNLGLTREALINIALLCGSDYTEGIRGVGPVTAMEILAKFPGPGLDGLNKFKSWWEKAQNQIELPVNQSKFLTKLKELDVRSDFPSSLVVEAYLSPTVDDSCEKCSWSLPNLDLLREFASQKLNWNRTKTDEVLLPVMKRLADKQTQRGIMSYFQPEVYLKPAVVKSKRLQNVVNKFVNPESDVTEPEPNEKKKGKRSIQKKEVNESTVIRDEPEKATSKGKRTNKSRKRKTDSDGTNPLQNEFDSDNKKNKKLKLDQAASDAKKLKSDKIDYDEEDRNQTVATRRTKRGNKKTDGEMNKGKKCSNIRQKTKKSQPCILSSETKEEENVSSSVNRKSDLISKNTDDSDDEDCRSGSSVNSVSDCDSVSSNSDDDDKNVVQSGLNVDEILGLKMGFEMDEVDTVGSHLDVEEILGLKMGCKLNEIISGNESRKEGIVYEHLVNVNEIIHLDSGSDQMVIDEHKDGHLKESVEMKDTILTESDEVTNEHLKESEEEPADGVDIDFALEGGFIREDDDIDEAKPNNETDSLAERKDILEKSEDSYQNSCLENDIQNSEYSDTLIVQEKKESLTRTSGTSRKTRSSRPCSSEQKYDDSKGDIKKIKKEPADDVELRHGCCSSATFSVAAIEPTPENDKEFTTETRSVENKASVINKSDYVVEPLKQFVSGLPWADKKKGKGKRKVSSAKTSGLKLIPKETVVKKKKPTPKNVIGCVNLSESDSDS